MVVLLPNTPGTPSTNAFPRLIGHTTSSTCFWHAQARRPGRWQQPCRTSSFSLVVIDLDHFKDINDNFGHLAGDYALQQVAETIRSNKRESDIAVRFGGEEFVLLLPGAAIDQAKVVAEKIRKTVETHKFATKEGITLHITISIGVSTLKPGILSLEALLEEADVALYESKQQGRNCVTIKTS